MASNNMPNAQHTNRMYHVRIGDDIETFTTPETFKEYVGMKAMEGFTLKCAEFGSQYCLLGSWCALVVLEPRAEEVGCDHCDWEFRTGPGTDSPEIMHMEDGYLSIRRHVFCRDCGHEFHVDAVYRETGVYEFVTDGQKEVY